MDITLVLGNFSYTAISVTPIPPPHPFSILENVEFAPFQKVWGPNKQVNMKIQCMYYRIGKDIIN